MKTLDFRPKELCLNNPDTAVGARGWSEGTRSNNRHSETHSVWVGSMSRWECILSLYVTVSCTMKERKDINIITFKQNQREGSNGEALVRGALSFSD